MSVIVSELRNYVYTDPEGDFRVWPFVFYIDLCGPAAVFIWHMIQEKRKNFKGKHFIDYDYACFEDKEDAALFKIIWA